MSCNSCGGKPKKPDCNSCKPRGPPKKIVNDCGPRNDCQEEEEVVPSFCISFPKGRMPVIKTICPPKDEEQSCSPEQPPACPTESDDDEEDCDDSEDSTNCEQSDNAPKTCDQAPPVIVVDMGSGFTKAGFAGELCPRIEMATVIGRPRAYKCPEDRCVWYSGDRAILKRCSTRFSYPISGGIVNSWRDVQKVYEQVFCLLNVEPENSSVLVTEPTPNPSYCREKLTEIMFEEFKVGNLYIGAQAAMSMYAAGKTTGTVLDIGEDLTQVVPVYEGRAIGHAALRQRLGGRDLTDFMMRLMTEKDYRFDTYKDRQEVKNVKETMCFVVENYKDALRQASCGLEQDYYLCDGTIYTLGIEMFRCPEALFKPSFLGLNARPIHEAIYQSINLVDKSLHYALYSNICLSGGSTMFRGLECRLLKEVKCLACPGTSVRVLPNPRRKHGAFLGAATVASLPCFREMVIRCDEYFEEGPRIVHRKCF